MTIGINELGMSCSGPSDRDRGAKLDQPNRRQRAHGQQCCDKIRPLMV